MDEKRLESALKDKLKSINLECTDTQFRDLMDFVQVCLVLQRYDILTKFKKVMADR